MPRGKNCLETIFVSQLSRNYPHHDGNFERGGFGGILGDNLGEGNCESKIVSRQWGDNPKNDQQQIPRSFQESLNGGSRPLWASCAQSCTVVHFCDRVEHLSKGRCHRKMMIIIGNRGQLWTSSLSPHLLNPPCRLSRSFSHSFASFRLFSSLLFCTRFCTFWAVCF